MAALSGPHWWAHPEGASCPGRGSHHRRALVQALGSSLRGAALVGAWELLLHPRTSANSIVVVDLVAGDATVTGNLPAGPWRQVLALPRGDGSVALLDEAIEGGVPVVGWYRLPEERDALVLLAPRAHTEGVRRSGALAPLACSYWDCRHIALADISAHGRGETLITAAPRHPRDCYPWELQ